VFFFWALIYPCFNQAFGFRLLPFAISKKRYNRGHKYLKPAPHKALQMSTLKEYRIYLDTFLKQVFETRINHDTFPSTLLKTNPEPTKSKTHATR
jgi:L-rhamnose mutarotase